jgi:hypothetical protein
MSRSKRPSFRGQSLIELVAGALIAVPMLLGLMDCGVILIGVGANDLACRDAARAAASGPPGLLAPGTRTVSGAGAPVTRAKQVLNRIYNLGIPVKLRDDLLSVRENIWAPVPSVPEGGSINGTVDISSTIDIYPPFIVGFVTHGSVSMHSRHSFPYTYVVPATTSGF